MALQTGTILDNRYRILGVLGQGGFGAVYRAADMTLKRPCAVKENLDTSPEAQRQFEKEAIVLAQLTHPNLPRVQDHFTLPGQGQYLVMDFVEGEDLEAIIARDGTIPQDKALDWIGQIANALTYLHEQNPPVIHRDLKPANIRVTPQGKTYLVDFGLVKIYDPHLRTTIGARAVTPGYSPMEQYGQGNTDARTDVYALAATMYTLLTGLEPQESVQRAVDDQLSPAHRANAGVSFKIGDAIQRAMSLKPTQRYQTVSEFQKVLQPPQEPSLQPKLTQVVPSMVQTAVPSQAVTPHVSNPPTSPAPVRSSAGTSAPSQPSVASGTQDGKPWWQQAWVIPLILIAVVVAFFGLRPGGFFSLANNPTPTRIVADDTPLTKTPLAQGEEVGRGQVNSNETQGDLESNVADLEITVTPVSTLSKPTVTKMRSSLTPTSTKTHVPPTPTIVPPVVILDYLDSVIVTRIDNFESSSKWDLGTGKVSNGTLEIIGNDWNGLAKKGLFLEGEGIIINFKYAKYSEFELMFDYGEWWTDPYRRFGIYFYSGYPKANLWLGRNGLGFNNLHGNFQPKADTWYTLLMAVDKDGEFLSLIWDPADTFHIFSYHEKAGENWAGKRWNFRIGANAGTIVFDNFMKITFDAMK